MDGSSLSTVSDQLTVLVSRSPEKDCCRVTALVAVASATLKQKITRWLESISVNTGNTTRQYSTVVYRCTGVVFAIILTARGLLQRVPEVSMRTSGHLVVEGEALVIERRQGRLPEGD